jgi:hypothetical protein
MATEEEHVKNIAVARLFLGLDGVDPLYEPPTRWPAVFNAKTQRRNEAAAVGKKCRTPARSAAAFE